MKLIESLGNSRPLARAVAAAVLCFGLAGCGDAEAAPLVDPVPLTDQEKKAVTLIYDEVEDYWHNEEDMPGLTGPLRILSGNETAKCLDVTIGSGDSSLYCRWTNEVVITAASVHKYGERPFGLFYLLSHEVAHRAQVVLGAPEKAGRELQADCYAGAFIGDRHPDAMLADAVISIVKGSPDIIHGGIGHGSDEQRQAAFDQGLTTRECASISVA